MILKNFLLLLIIIFSCFFLLTYNTPTPARTPSRLVKKEQHKAQQQRKKTYYAKAQQMQNNNNDGRHTMHDGRHIAKLLNLADLYINGIPDTYNLSGTKLSGIEPAPDKAMEVLMQAIKLGSTTALLKLGKIYHYGVGDLEPNLIKAKNIYTIVLNRNEPTLKFIASEKLKDIIHEQQQQHFLNQSQFFPFQAQVRAQAPLSFQPLTRFLQTSNNNSNATVNINTVFRVPPGHNVVPTTEPAGQTGIINDMHNVHDHAVIATLSQSYRNLEKDTKLTVPKNKCCKELREYVKKNLHNDKQNDAILALDTIEKNYIPHTGIDATESDALAIVWNRINSKFADELETQKTIKDNLANGLSEMIEHNKVCCVTGRLSRILDSLNVIDDAVQIKPTFAINQEMMDKASQISKKIVESAPEQVKDDYNNAKDTPAVSNLTEKIKTTIKDELKKDYVDTNILTQEGFEAQIGGWINEI